VNIFNATSLNRKQFWLSSLALFVIMVVIYMVMFAIAGREDDVAIDIFLRLAYALGNLRLIYLRAVDVGYARPGRVTAGCLIPFIGLFWWLSIGFLPTGSRIGKEGSITNAELATRIA
jgi:uncharacterized membrane protein YhaH (DUF805 family)